MEKRFYFDTSIWLDFFENRDEPNFPKGTLAKELIDKIIRENWKIIFSDNNMLELINSGYLTFEAEELINQLRFLLIFVKSSEREIGKAKDLAAKRGIPRRDALHALIARDNNAILITYDNHFIKLNDIISFHNPREFIH